MVAFFIVGRCTDSLCRPALSVVPGTMRSMTTGIFLALVFGLIFGLLVGAVLGLGWGRATAAPAGHDDRERAADQAVLREGMERLHDQLRDLEHARVSWQGQLHQQVSDMRLSNDELRRETHALSTALRTPQVRGRWGELHLRRAVELAGLVDRCDFSEQVHLTREGDTAARPDLVVRLAGGGSVPVDAKVPLDAYLDAVAATEDSARSAHLARHAKAMRHHVDALAAKRYWRAVPGSPEFVVLFVPAESFLAAALDSDPALIDDAAAKRVVLASPTTLIALLRTVAHGWSHAELAEQAGEVHRLGRELHERLQRFAGHLDQVGRSLAGAVGHYNQAVGSLESRVLVAARRLGDGAGGDDLSAPRQITQGPRNVTVADDPLSPPARHVHGL